MAYHRLSKEAREERNRKIVKMVNEGYLQADVARRYGLETDSVRSLVNRLRKAGVNITTWQQNPRGLERPSYCEGP